MLISQDLTFGVFGGGAGGGSGRVIYGIPGSFTGKVLQSLRFQLRKRKIAKRERRIQTGHRRHRHVTEQPVLSRVSCFQPPSPPPLIPSFHQEPTLATILTTACAAMKTQKNTRVRKNELDESAEEVCSNLCSSNVLDSDLACCVCFRTFLI